MKKIKKYFLRTLAVIVAVFLLLFVIVFAYVSVNKKKIIAEVTSELSKRINGNVSVGNVELSFFRDFPTVSVLLHDVKITDTMYKVHGHAFLEVKEVYGQLSVMKLFKKQGPLKGVKLVNGTVYLFTDTSGYSNNYLFKQKADSASSSKKGTEKNTLHTIALNDMRLVVDDRKREKFHDLLLKNMEVNLDDANEQKLQIAVNANIFVNSLAFNVPRGSFLKGKTFKGNFELLYDKQLKVLQFDSIDVKLEGQPYNLSGKFELAGTAPQFNFRIHTSNVIYDKVKELLPARIAASLSIVSIDNPLNADASIVGPLKGGDPVVYIKWDSKEVHMTTPFMDFDEAKFTGYFTNEVVPGLPRKDPNSKIVINNFSALWHNLPVNSTQIEILNLDTPTLTCDLKSAFPLATLNEMMGEGALQLTSGNALVDMTYKGPIQRNDKTNSFLNGSITFKDGTVLYAPRNVEMKNVSATMLFKNSDVFIDNFQTTVFNNKFDMQGDAKNLLTLINTEPNNINIDWNINTTSLDLNPFTYMLSPRKKVISSKKVAIANMAAKIDQILDQGKLHVHLKANKLLFRKFEGENVQADISLLNDRYDINSVSMNHAGGKMIMSGSLVPELHNNMAKVNFNVNNVDVSRLFRAFENFGQDGITSESLEGNVSANVVASLNLSESGKVNANSLASTIDFSIKNGALNNYEPVKKMQSLIFKKRDFENIRFAELKDRLEVKNQEIKINRMEIQSSVLSMFVEGVYSMKGNTDISIQVPLNNLKKRDSTYNPENKGTDKKGGKSVYLRGRTGGDGNVKFSLDLFNKFKKEKEQEEDKYDVKDSIR